MSVAATRPAGSSGSPGSPRRKPGATRSGPAETARRPRKRVRPPARAIVVVVGGVLWAVLLAAVLVESSFLTAVVLIPVAALATLTGVKAAEPRRSRRGGKPRGAKSRGGRARSGQNRSLSPVVVAGLAASALDPLIALGGPILALVALVVSFAVIGRLVLVAGFESAVRPLREASGLLAAAFGPALGVTSIVIARHQGSSLALALVGALMLFDAGACVMGHNRTALGGPVGAVFGAASVTIVAVFAAAVMNPPFGGSKPWVLFAVVAGLAPLGVMLGQLAVGDDRLPAVRRVDSWTLAAPAWVLLAALLLHR